MKYTQEQEKKIGRLQTLCNKYGDFKVAIAGKNKDGVMFWSKHKSVLQCWEEGEKGLWFLANCNNRQILSCEIILDLDTPESISQFEKICDRLDKSFEQYCVYSTGSKGFHIHIKEKKLSLIDIHKRPLFRELYIISCLGDLMKKNEVMIALENCPHWKTGNIKKVVRCSKRWEDF